KDEVLEKAGLADACLWRTDRGEWLMTTVEARLSGGRTQTYFLPLAIDWGEDRPGREQAAALARVRQRAQTGILFDALAQEEFVRDLIDRIARGDREPVGCGGGTLTFEATRALETLLPDDLDAEPVRRPATEGTNSTFLVGDRLFLKAYRRLRWGMNPEWEMGRFLTEVSPCSAVVPVAGAIQYHDESGRQATLALLQAATKNQGDGWTFTANYLERFLDDALARAPESPPEDATRHADYLVLIRTLAQRTADLHRALAVSTGDPAFEPEPFEADALRAWVDRIGAELDETITMLRTTELPEGLEIDPESLERLDDALRSRLDQLRRRPISAVRTRYHGDYHLGQVLLTAGDFVIVDLEGEPARSYEQRRMKAPPLKDVAGMLRSFDYARSAAARSYGAERQVDRTELDPLLDDWRDAVREAFLEQYRLAMEGSIAYPESPKEFAPLLELGTLEKLLYEVRYEPRIRPNWLPVPLRDLDAMIKA